MRHLIHGTLQQIIVTHHACLPDVAVMAVCVASIAAELQYGICPACIEGDADSLMTCFHALLAGTRSVLLGSLADAELSPPVGLS